MTFSNPTLLFTSSLHHPISLENIGVALPLEVGNREVGYNVKPAPGKLSRFTKIIRFMPRFTIINNSKRDIELQQPTGFSGDYEKCSLKAGHLRLYHLPDVYSER